SPVLYYLSIILCSTPPAPPPPPTLSLHDALPISRAGLSLGQVDDPDAMARPHGLGERAAARELDVVAMRRDREEFHLLRGHGLSRSAECGVRNAEWTARTPSPIAGPDDRTFLCNSAFRIPHSALLIIRISTLPPDPAWRLSPPARSRRRAPP